MKAGPLFFLAAVACAAAVAASPEPKPPAAGDPTAARSTEVAAAPLSVPPGRLLVNLMMEGRLAWFSWMSRPELKPKLVVAWTAQGRAHTKTWQHGVDGSEWPQAFFLQRGNEPGDVRWAGHPDLGPGREGHKHHFFSKDSPGRVAFMKADLSEIPGDATITRAELVLHIHDKEGLKAGATADVAGVARFRHVNHDWDWDHVTYTHFAAGQPWTSPQPAYPYFGDGDVSPVLWSLDRQADLAARGYHKNGVRDYPLDLTAYVARLQQLRAGSSAVQPMRGQIVIDPQDPRWLRRHQGRPVFICGPGEPEDFLYRGTRKADGTRDGDQLALIDQLVTHGGNCLYLQTVRTHGGDAREDRTHNPFVDSDPARGLDTRILDQWERWFTRMDEQGIVIYFQFYDDGARIWDTGDNVGPEERAYFETLVRRFKHHRNLIWVVAEESEERYSTARVQGLARIIRQADEHAHPIGNHHQSGTIFKAWRPGGALDHFSMQYNQAGAEAHAGAVEAFHRAEGRYNVIYAESTAAPTDADGVRRHAWASAMAGVMPILYNLDVARASHEMLAQCRHLQRFFEATDFTTMVPADALATGATTYVLADAGRSYLAYTERADGSLGLRDLPAGRCLVTWLDCRTGARSEETHTFAAGGNRAFGRPAGIGAEAAAWIRFPDIAATAAARRPSAGVAAIAAPAANDPPAAPDQKVRTRDGAELYIQLAITDADGPGPYTYTIVEPPKHGTLAGDNNDRFYTPKPGFAGADEFTWKVNDGHADSRIARVTIFVPAAVRLPSGVGRYFPPPESQGGWRKAANEDEIRELGGMDPAKLDALREWLLASDKRDFAAVVIRHGRIVLEVERGNSAITDSRRVASVSKAICATVLAIASDLSQQGGLPRKMSFDDRAFDFIPWAQPLSDPRKAEITVRQLFNTTSGICPESTGASNLGTWDYVLGHSGDSRTARLAFDPGTGSGYSTLAIYHAALVCETVTGQPYDQFAIQHLFKPIGCEHWWFQYFDGSGEIGRHPNHNMGMPARDLARIAYCLLRGGRWNGRPIVPAWFVEETAAPTHDVRGGAELRTGREPSHYSHAWERPTWLTGRPEPGSASIPGDARFKRGSGGQLIAFVPSLDLVVTRQTGGSGQWSYEEFLGLACEAVLKADNEPAR